MWTSRHATVSVHESGVCQQTKGSSDIPKCKPIQTKIFAKLMQTKHSLHFEPTIQTLWDVQELFCPFLKGAQYITAGHDKDVTRCSFLSGHDVNFFLERLVERWELHGLNPQDFFIGTVRIFSLWHGDMMTWSHGGILQIEAFLGHAGKPLLVKIFAKALFTQSAKLWFHLHDSSLDFPYFQRFERQQFCIKVFVLTNCICS